MQLTIRTAAATLSLGALLLGVGWLGGRGLSALAEEVQFVPPPPPGNIINIELEQARLRGPRVFDGVIGVQVRRNPARLLPADWYRRQDFPKGSPRPTTVDGFPGLVDGTSVYVAAPNFILGSGPTPNRSYVNVYLLSYGAGSSPDTQEIARRLLENWHFLSTFPETYPDPEGPAEAKNKLRRDFQRLVALGTVIGRLQDYRGANGTYPTLSSGSYLAGRSASNWPSWQATLGQALGGTLPVDPLNSYDTDIPRDGISNCDTLSGFATTTCFAEPNTTAVPPRPYGEYRCPDGAHVFNYVAGSPATLFSNFEFKSIEWPSSLAQGTVTVPAADNACDSVAIELGNLGAVNWQSSAAGPF